MDSPTVSVLLTVYNGEPYLKETIQSILDQTYSDFELVVVNDGSIDATPEILASIDDNRLQVFNQPNRGRPQALNHGLIHCRGKFISIIDDDDLAAPHRLEQQVSFLEEQPDIDIVGSWYERRHESETPIDVENVEVPTTDKLVREALPTYNPLAHSSVTYRKSAVSQVGGYNVSLQSCVDYDLWVRLAAAEFKFAAINESLCTIRKHSHRSFNFSGRDRLRRWFTTWSIQRQATQQRGDSIVDQLRVGVRSIKILVEDIVDELRR